MRCVFFISVYDFVLLVAMVLITRQSVTSAKMVIMDYNATINVTAIACLARPRTCRFVTA